MNYLIGTARKFWSLEGFVAIIFVIFTIKALMCGSILGSILMGIFSYWWLKRILGKPIKYKSSPSKWNGGSRNIDL